jgi:hypothetical protein
MYLAGFKNIKQFFLFFLYNHIKNGFINTKNWAKIRILSVKIVYVFIQDW